MKSLLRNITIGNIILAALVAFFVFSEVSPLFTAQVSSPLPAANKQEQEISEEEQEIQVPSPTDFISVAEQNLFHPERKIPVEKKDEQPLPKPEFVLYGTMISDGLSLAYVEDLKAPRNSPGRGKRQIALKKGDTFSGFILKEIYADSIVLTRGEEKLVVAINDSAHPKNRVASAAITTAPTVPGKVSKGSPGAAQQAVQPVGAVRRPPTPGRQQLRTNTNPLSPGNPASGRTPLGLPKN